MEFIEYSVEDRIGYITLNRPEKRNALSFQLVTELKKAFKNAEEDSLVKVIILRAKGEAFCAGADLAYLQELQNFSFEENLQDSHHLMELFLAIYNHPKVVIASVQGHALAGGCGLAALCDFIYTVPAAKFGYTEVKIGFIPALVMVFLLRKMGEGRAKELLLSGDIYSSEEMLTMGLINRVVEAEILEEEVKKMATRLINTNSEQSMKLTKQLIGHVQSLPLEEGLLVAAKSNAHARSTEDCKRGIAAFLSKEKIKW